MDSFHSNTFSEVVIAQLMMAEDKKDSVGQNKILRLYRSAVEVGIGRIPRIGIAVIPCNDTHLGMQEQLSL